MVTKSEIKAFIEEYFHLQPHSITMKTRIDKIARDHHDLINFSFEFEKQFEVEFDDDEVQKIRSAGEFIHLVLGKKSGKISEDSRKKAA